MFDNIGQGPDLDELKRGGASLMISILLVGAIGGGIMAWLSLKAVQAVLPPTPEEDLVAVEIIEEVLAEAPPPPPPPAAAAAVEEEEEEEEKDPEEPVEDVKPLEEKIPDEIKDDKITGVPGGDPNGVDGGDPNGVPGGQPGGDPNGIPGGTGSSFKTVSHAAIEWKKNPKPDYPEAAQQMNLGQVDCTLTLYLDEEGVPENIEYKNCPKVFHDATREGLMKWRAYPTKPKVKRKTLFKLKYVPV